jgi:hypothetical protein
MVCVSVSDDRNELAELGDGCLVCHKHTRKVFVEHRLYLDNTFIYHNQIYFGNERVEREFTNYLP